MTIHKCKDCVEYDEKWCQFWCEPKKDGNTCKEWIDDKERITNHIESETRRKEFIGKRNQRPIR